VQGIGGLERDQCRLGVPQVIERVLFALAPRAWRPSVVLRFGHALNE